mmetsp:Transcript_28890/g.63679  ORF Transcript_28890/g.63679 Transcript_28890/m.63679 type:complete len:246 (+) Transcript_28890:3219-3956(+)
MSAVAEVEPGHVHASINQLAQPLLRVTCGAQRAHDLGLAWRGVVVHHVVEADGCRTQGQGLVHGVGRGCRRLDVARGSLDGHHGHALRVRSHRAVHHHHLLAGGTQPALNGVNHGLLQKNLEVHILLGLGQVWDLVGVQREDGADLAHCALVVGDDQHRHLGPVLSNQAGCITLGGDDHDHAGVNVQGILCSAAQHRLHSGHRLVTEVADEVVVLVVVDADLRIGHNGCHGGDGLGGEGAVSSLT